MQFSDIELEIMICGTIKDPTPNQVPRNISFISFNSSSLISTTRNCYFGNPVVVFIKTSPISLFSRKWLNKNNISVVNSNFYLYEKDFINMIIPMNKWTETLISLMGFYCHGDVVIFYNEGQKKFVDNIIRKFGQKYIDKKLIFLEINQVSQVKLLEIWNSSLTDFVFLSNNNNLSFIKKAASLNMFVDGHAWIVVDLDESLGNFILDFPYSSNIIVLKEELTLGKSNDSCLSVYSASSNWSFMEPNQVKLAIISFIIANSTSVCFNGSYKSLDQILLLNIPISRLSIFSLNTNKTLSRLAYFDNHTDINQLDSLQKTNLLNHGISIIENRTFYACSPWNEPWLYFPQNSQTNFSVFELKGILMESLQMITKNLKINLMIQKMDTYDYGKCVSTVNMGIYDMGASLFTYNNKRKELVDFITPIMEDNLVVLMRQPKPDSKLWSVLNPLSTWTWLVLIVIGIVVGIILKQFSSYSPMSAWNLNLPYAVSDEIKYTENILSIYGSFLQQGQDFYPYSLSGRTILSLWWIFSCIIYSSYSADLTSFLTIPFVQHRIETIKELADTIKIKPHLQPSYLPYMTLKSSLDMDLQKLAQRIVTFNDCTSNITLENDYSYSMACFSDESFLREFQFNNPDKLYIMNERVDSSTVGLIFRKKSLITSLFKLRINRLLEIGFFVKKYSKYWEDKENMRLSNSSSTDSLYQVDIIGIGGILIIVFILYGLGFLILGCEIIYKNILIQKFDANKVEIDIL